MKYYLLNRDEVKENIWTNPILIRTKSLSKIKKIRTLQKKLNTLLKQVEKELKESNTVSTHDKFSLLIDNEDATEISRADYNALLVMCLMDTQEQRIRCCNKSETLKGKLYGNTIR